MFSSFPERSEGNEVMKIAVHDKCFGGRKDFGGVEMVQGAQPRRSTVEPACMVHGCADVRSSFAGQEWTF